MDEVIIFCAGKMGVKLKTDIEKTGKYKVIYFCDNSKEKQGQFIDDVEILSFDAFVNLCNESKSINVIISIFDSEEIVKQIRDCKIRVNLYGVTWSYYQKREYSVFDMELNIYQIDYRKPRLRYYEYHIADHCNLKCKGCGHYSNVATEKFGNLEQYKKDIKRLKELFWGVCRIRLMGGEPLLNKELSEFITITRDVFPDANIRVVSNGLLIPNAEEVLLRTMRDNRVEFDITLYPPTSKIQSKIIERCEKNGVFCSFSQPVTEFFDIYNEKGDSDKEENFTKCISKTCHFLRNGKLSVCVMPILDKEYGFSCGNRIENTDIINIYEDIDGFRCNEILDTALDRCRYCDNINKKHFKWEGNYPYLL